MPIAPEKRHYYQSEAWRFVTDIVRIRAGGQCEICGAVEGKPHPQTGSIVVLTCMHLSHEPSSYSMSDIAAACQRCHNAYDAAVRAENRRRRVRMALEKVQLVLPCLKLLKIKPASNEISGRQKILHEIYQKAVDAANFNLNREYEVYATDSNRS